MQTEEEEAAEGAGDGRVDDAAEGEIETGVPFGVEIVLRGDCGVVRHRIRGGVWKLG